MSLAKNYKKPGGNFLKSLKSKIKLIDNQILSWFAFQAHSWIGKYSLFILPVFLLIYEDVALYRYGMNAMRHGEYDNSIKYIPFHFMIKLPPPQNLFGNP